MFEDETKKQFLIKLLLSAFVIFAVIFLAFYIVMEIMLHKMADPTYNAKRIERVIKHQQREFRKIDEMMMENPFVPKMRPMLVNLIKEASEYKVIVDLRPLDNDEKGVNVNLEDNILTISGEIDKKMHGNEKIIRFSQSYYLDQKLETDKISKEKKGDKYIITIPFENQE